MSPTIPAYDEDLFSDAALDEPYDHYRALRDLGPVVWLPQHEVFAVPRYDEVRQVLADPDTFCSGQGVGLNDFINHAGRGTTLMSDGEAHACQRDIIYRPLAPKALAELRPEVQVLADELVDRLVEQGSFDAVGDLAEVIPSTWVPDLLGWPEDGREHLLDWGAANFDALGPPNARADAAGAGLLEMVAFARRVAAGELPSDSIAAGILAAAARGDIDPSQCPMLMIDYLAPSLDTTVSAMGNAIWLFATHPDQWDLVREDPSRIKNAFNEVLRVESPLSCFTRVTTRATELGGVSLPEGSRVLVMFASANRDERRWDQPEVFDVRREAAGHVGFGHGIHLCAGAGLARLEANALLSALAAKVERFELGTAIRKPNNLIRSFASLPVRISG